MFDFKFADIGEGIHEGVILKWYFKEGDTVKEGETLCVIETDKVNAEIPAPVAGTIEKLGAKLGETIHVGETLVLINEKGTPTKKADAPKEKEVKSTEPETKPIAEGDEKNNAGVVGALDVSEDVIAASNETVASKKATTEKILATPIVRKIAKDAGINLQRIVGSGPAGRIKKQDVLNYQTSQSKEGSYDLRAFPMPKIPKERTRREKISKLRQTIVTAMNTSNTLIPATTVMDEFDVTELVLLREKNKNSELLNGVKLTYLPLIIKAIILTLKEFPVFNASFDHETNEVIFKDYFNIGIAVDTDGGLIVPNIKDADQKSILELAKEVDTLAKAARDRKIQLSDLQNTTFSITNYGAFGSKLGTPVIKHPEVAILGMGMITKKPVVIDNEIVIRDMFPVSLTIDHRIIDGGDAGRFMVKLRTYLNNPITLLLS